MPAGRPPKYKSPEEMQILIDQYFNDCWNNYLWLSEKGNEPEEPCTRDKLPTISGLAYVLDMSTEAFRNYEQKDEFLATVKRAKQRVEMVLEQNLYGTAVTGSIFSLKNNFGWKDKTEQEVTASFNVTMPNKDAGTL